MSEADPSRIDEYVRAIDDDPDLLHLDVTPASQALADIGLPAVPALLDLLGADSEETRLHAQRALEMVVYGRHGFVSGRGFPSAEAEQAARDDLIGAGYEHDDPPERREAAIARLRGWHERQVADADFRDTPAMDLGLEGRVALVTGGSKGIGLGIATALAAEGARVAVASRTREAVEAAAEQIGGQGFVFDSGDLDAIPGLLDDVESALGPIDIYIANTGGPPPNPDPLGFTREQWEAAHRTLVLSPMTILQRLLPQMARARLGPRRRASSRARCASRSPRSSSPTPTAPASIVGFKVLATPVRRRRRHAQHASMPGRIATDRMIDTAGSREAAEAAGARHDPRRPPRRARRHGRRRRVPVLRPGELHHRHRRCSSTAGCTVSVS